MDTMFAKRAVHADRRDFIELGIHAPPLDLSATYPTPISTLPHVPPTASTPAISLRAA